MFLFYQKPKSAVKIANDEFIGDYAFQMPPALPVTTVTYALDQENQFFKNEKVRKTNNKLVTFSCDPPQSKKFFDDKINYTNDIGFLNDKTYVNNSHEDEKDNLTKQKTKENNEQTTSGQFVLFSSLKKTPSDLILEYNKKFLDKNVSLKAYNLFPPFHNEKKNCI